jgi:large conductance mechanosensitive channel
MKKFFADFKKFITRGNVLDLAVAVIIGGAFSKIVGSLVKDILMPVISLVIGEKGFENYKYVISPADEVNGIAENAITYGVFIQNIIDFLIIAFVIFVIIRSIMRISELANAKKIEVERLQKEEEERIKAEKAALEPVQPKVEDLLQDIKVLLEKNLK